MGCLARPPTGCGHCPLLHSVLPQGTQPREGSTFPTLLSRNGPEPDQGLQPLELTPTHGEMSPEFSDLQQAGAVTPGSPTEASPGRSPSGVRTLISGPHFCGICQKTSPHPTSSVPRTFSWSLDFNVTSAGDLGSRTDPQPDRSSRKDPGSPTTPCPSPGTASRLWRSTGHTTHS